MKKQKLTLEYILKKPASPPLSASRKATTSPLPTANFA
jgi:hypothetical protein